jgi:heme O synthase-like polyprenyltransferase
VVALRYVLWLAVAGIGWLIFATNLLYWGIVFVTLALDIGIYYLTLGMAKRALQGSADIGAA